MKKEKGKKNQKREEQEEEVKNKSSLRRAPNKGWMLYDYVIQYAHSTLVFFIAKGKIFFLLFFLVCACHKIRKLNRKIIISFIEVSE